MDFSALIESINTAAVTSGPSSVNDNERRELLQACEKLRNAYETSLDVVSRLYYSVCMLGSIILYIYNDNM